jgi:hypothetical protein
LIGHALNAAAAELEVEVAVIAVVTADCLCPAGVSPLSSALLSALLLVHLSANKPAMCAERRPGRAANKQLRKTEQSAPPQKRRVTNQLTVVMYEM